MTRGDPRRTAGGTGAAGHDWLDARSPGVELRHMGADDVAFCVVQTGREGWTSTADDFAVHLAHDPTGCMVATAGGERLAMITTTRYRTTGWIGNLIVTPESRGRGLGSLLMERAIRHLEAAGVATHRLEADPPGVGIYRRLGFVDEYASPRFRLEPVAPRAVPATVGPLVAAELPAAAAFDAERFGDDRARLLPLLLARARVALRVPRRGALAGYLLMLRGTLGARIGPWVADDPCAAAELLRGALASAGAGGVTLAVPGPNRDAREVLDAEGFRETPSSLRMVRGAPPNPGRPATVYALANGACG